MKLSFLIDTLVLPSCFIVRPILYMKFILNLPFDPCIVILNHFSFLLI